MKISSVVRTKKERMLPIRPIGTKTGKYVLLIKSPGMEKYPRPQWRIQDFTGSANPTPASLMPPIYANVPEDQNKAVNFSSNQTWQM